MPVLPEVPETVPQEASPAPALVVPTPGVVSLEHRGLPVPGPGEVLVQPAAVGLCGTDLDILAGRIHPAYVRYPLVLGHEWSGTVLESGGPLPPGTRVVAEGIVPCGHCAACRACETQPVRHLRRDGVHPGRGRGRVRRGRRDPGASPGRPGEHGRRGAGRAGPSWSTGAGQHHGQAGLPGPGGRGRHRGPARGGAARAVVPGRDRDAGPPPRAEGAGRARRRGPVRDRSELPRRRLRPGRGGGRDHRRGAHRAGRGPAGRYRAAARPAPARRHRGRPRGRPGQQRPHDPGELRLHLGRLAGRGQAAERGPARTGLPGHPPLPAGAVGHGPGHPARTRPGNPPAKLLTLPD